MRYMVNRSDIVYEEFDEEIVIINLDTGNYYSFGGSGTDIWSFVEKGATVTEIVQRLEDGFDENISQEITEAVRKFVAELESEGLIVPAPSGERGDEREAVGQGSVPVPSVKGSAFVAPTLEKYTDMQEFLLVDPIHEIDYTDWPKKHKKS